MRAAAPADTSPTQRCWPQPRYAAEQAHQCRLRLCCCNLRLLATTFTTPYCEQQPPHPFAHPEAGPKVHRPPRLIQKLVCNFTELRPTDRPTITGITQHQHLHPLQTKLPRPPVAALLSAITAAAHPSPPGQAAAHLCQQLRHPSMSAAGPAASGSAAPACTGQRQKCHHCTSCSSSSNQHKHAFNTSSSPQTMSHHICWPSEMDASSHSRHQIQLAHGCGVTQDTGTP